MLDSVLVYFVLLPVLCSFIALMVEIATRPTETAVRLPSLYCLLFDKMNDSCGPALE